jgi:hypothetical protein
MVVVELVTLAECPPGLFMFGDTLGFKTEYGAMRCVPPFDVPGDQLRWTVSQLPDAYVVASGEYFWGGTSSHKDRAKLLVTPVDATRLATWDAAYRRMREALELARPIVEADVSQAGDYCDSDWEGMSRTALEAIDAALTPASDAPAVGVGDSQIELAARYVLDNSRRGNASLNDDQFAADTARLLDAYRDIIRKAVASGHLTTSPSPAALATSADAGRLEEALRYELAAVEADISWAEGRELADLIRRRERMEAALAAKEVG